jgi:hypothetical protein
MKQHNIPVYDNKVNLFTLNGNSKVDLVIYYYESNYLTGKENKNMVRIINLNFFGIEIEKNSY